MSPPGQHSWRSRWELACWDIISWSIYPVGCLVECFDDPGRHGAGDPIVTTGGKVFVIDLCYLFRCYLSGCGRGNDGTGSSPHICTALHMTEEESEKT
jgi:hypothetical protein